MQKGQVEPRFGLRRRCLWVCRIVHARSPRRLEEESAVSIEGGRLGRVDDDLGRRVAVRHVDGPAAVLVLEPRVAPQQPPARLLLGASARVPPPTPVAGAYDGEEERDGRQQLRELRGAAHARPDEGGIVVVEGEERIMRLSQRRLCGHCGP